MRPPYSPAIQLALGSLGVLSLAQLAGAAESSPLDAQGEPCPSCDPSAVEDAESFKKPVSAGVIHQPANPVAKQSPDFSASRNFAASNLAVSRSAASSSAASSSAASSTGTGDTVAPAQDGSTAPLTNTTGQRTAAADMAQSAASEPAPAPVPEASQGRALPAMAPAPQGSNAAVSTVPGVEAGAAAEPDAVEASVAARVAADEGSPELNQGEVDVVGGASPTVAEDEGTLELSQGEESSAAASRVRPDRPSRVDLPAFVSVSGDHLQDQDGRTHYRARPIASPSNHEALNRSAASGSTTAKRPISLPQVVSHSELAATDVMSVWNRSIPARKPEPAQPWNRHIPPEAMPVAVVQAPPSRPTPGTHAAAAVAVAPSGVASHRGRVTPSEPVLPVFATPRTKVKAGQNPPVDLSLVSARAESADISTTSQDLLEPQGTLAQAETAEASPREDLLIEPLATDPVPTVRYTPSPNAGIPSAFGAAWGDLFASLTGSGADRIRNEVDGSISAGLGLGNPRTAVGVELAYNLLSVRNFAKNGSFDVKVHREVFANDTTQAAVAVGWNNFVNYGDDVDGSESSVYGVVSAAHLLQPNNPANRLPVTGTLGVGGGPFSDDDSDVGVLAGVGLQVDPRLSLNAAWSGVGLNVGASVVPWPEIPLTLTAVYGDVTNNTDAGSVATLTIGYGFNFGPRF